MDRCELAMEYRKKGLNCAQSVAAAFGDLTRLPEKEMLAVSGGFGGGIGGTHEEVCGALSGAVMVLGMLFPHTEEGSPETKRRLYKITSEFWAHFHQTFHQTRCSDLLTEKIAVGGHTPAAERMGITAHCPILIVTAVELLEETLRANGINC